MELCDLHAHTIYSDGTDTPTALVELAESIGLSAVALTDHNNISGLTEFLQAAEGKRVQAVPGIEFSTDYKGTELHILGLWIGSQHYGTITDMMEAIRSRKDQCNRDLVQRLNEAGYELDYEKLSAMTPDGYVNRAHMATALTEKGYTATVQDAFKQLLSVKAGYYQPPKLPDALEIIRFIRSIGAVSVLAHPFLNLPEAGIREFLQEAKPAGLHGMEVLYGMYDAQTTALSIQLADEFGLCYSGGSDYHGGNKPHIWLGKGRGALAIPMDFCRKLAEKKNENCKL